MNKQTSWKPPEMPEAMRQWAAQVGVDSRWTIDAILEQGDAPAEALESC